MKQYKYMVFAGMALVFGQGVQAADPATEGVLSRDPAARLLGYQEVQERVRRADVSDMAALFDISNVLSDDGAQREYSRENILGQRDCLCALAQLWKPHATQAGLCAQLLQKTKGCYEQLLRVEEDAHALDRIFALGQAAYEGQAFLRSTGLADIEGLCEQLALKATGCCERLLEVDVDAATPELQDLMMKITGITDADVTDDKIVLEPRIEIGPKKPKKKHKDYVGTKAEEVVDLAVVAKKKAERNRLFKNMVIENTNDANLVKFIDLRTKKEGWDKDLDLKHVVARTRLWILFSFATFGVDLLGEKKLLHYLVEAHKYQEELRNTIALLEIDRELNFDFPKLTPAELLYEDMLIYLKQKYLPLYEKSFEIFRKTFVPQRVSDAQRLKCEQEIRRSMFFEVTKNSDTPNMLQTIIDIYQDKPVMNIVTALAKMMYVTHYIPDKKQIVRNDVTIRKRIAAYLKDVNTYLVQRDADARDLEQELCFQLPQNIQQMYLATKQTIEKNPDMGLHANKGKKDKE